MDSIKGAQILRERFGEPRAESGSVEQSATEDSHGGSDFVARITAWTRALPEGPGGFEPPAKEL
jgi:hypothetical protein